MQYAFEPYVLKRFAEGRIFFISHKMPFEFFADCFFAHQPFFLISQLEDGRICLAPNWWLIPRNLLQAGFGPQFLLPTEYEYVTTEMGTLPLIVTAHPVQNVDLWLKKFDMLVKAFAKLPFNDFVTTCFEYTPVKFEKKMKVPMPVPEPIT